MGMFDLDPVAMANIVRLAEEVREQMRRELARKIVEVQPLLQPTGPLAYLQFRYSTNKGTRRYTEEKINWIKEGF